MKTLCIIPVYNEELNLKDTLASVRMHNFGVDKFLFVNSGSTDKSSQILNESEFEILNIKKNRGIGYVIIKGIDYCIENNFDVLTIIHGGNKMDTKDFLPILNQFLMIILIACGAVGLLTTQVLICQDLENYLVDG